MSIARSSYHPGANDEEPGSSTVEFELPLHSGEHSSFSGDCVLDFPSSPAVHTVLVQCELVDHQGGRSWTGTGLVCILRVVTGGWEIVRRIVAVSVSELLSHQSKVLRFQKK